MSDVVDQPDAGGPQGRRVVGKLDGGAHRQAGHRVPGRRKYTLEADLGDGLDAQGYVRAVLAAHAELAAAPEAEASGRRLDEPARIEVDAARQTDAYSTKLLELPPIV